MIGVFDSGSGGLTVLSAIRAALPERDLVYLGDHRHAPYGERSEAEILSYTTAGVDRLLGLGCRLVVVACNTAAAVALRPIQQKWLPQAWPERRILGVFVPMVEAITGRRWRRHEPVPVAVGPTRLIGVFATPRTVLTCAWIREIQTRAPGTRVVQQQCPGLAALIENGASAQVLDDAIDFFVGGLVKRLDRRPDAVVLGCTHYPLVAERFRDALPAGVTILDQPNAVATSLLDYLARHPAFAPAPQETGRSRYYTTGDPTAAAKTATQFLGCPVSFDALDSTGAVGIPAGEVRRVAGERV